MLINIYIYASRIKATFKKISNSYMTRNTPNSYMGLNHCSPQKLCKSSPEIFKFQSKQTSGEYQPIGKNLAQFGSRNGLKCMF